jgi:O-antigen/teichoic acid export membrane protein
VGLAPIPFILCASAEQVLNFTFGANYLPATPVLKILSFCFTFMVLQDVLSTIIAGLGNPGFSMGLSLVLLPTQLFMIYTASLTFLLPVFGFFPCACSVIYFMSPSSGSWESWLILRLRSGFGDLG